MNLVTAELNAAFWGSLAEVAQYARRPIAPAVGQRSLWKEDDHPRGQPENAGEFREKDSSAPVTKPSPEADRSIVEDSGSGPDSKSKGHVFFDGNLEYFRDESGRLIRAKRSDSIAEDGRRPGTDVLSGAARAVASKEQPNGQPKESETAPAEAVAEMAIAEVTAPNPPSSPLPEDDQPPPSYVEDPQEKKQKELVQGFNDAIQDFGERIEGARKHTSRKTGSKADDEVDGEKDDRPAWARRYSVIQTVTKSGMPEKWSVVDTKQKGFWGKSGKLMRGITNGGEIDFKSKEEAEADIPLIEVSRNHRAATRRLSDGSRDYCIVRLVGEKKRPVVMGGFQSYDDALKFMLENPRQIIEHKFPSYEEYAYLDRVERSGPSVRSGDVSPSDFQSDFGFRGGQFGNWNMGKDGQTSLNHAFDSLHDLASVLGIPTSAISLSGDLAIAFGARGSGGKNAARAHYEPDERVINLTKMHGAGSLAHEYGHALDYYIGKQAGVSSHSVAAASDFHLRRTKLRPEVEAAYQAVMQAITTREAEITETHEKDRKKSDIIKTSLKERLDSLDRGIEHAMQRTYGRKGKGLNEAQKKEWDKLKADIVDGDFGKRIPLPSKANTFMSTYEKLARLNELYKEATGRSFHQADPNSTGNDLYWQMTRMKDADEKVSQANSGKRKADRIRSNFVNEAIRLDDTRTSNYYSEPRELMARSFEAWIADKLHSQGRRSDYLVGHGKTKNESYVLHDMKPFPEGDEREAINAAFDNLFQVLQVEDTGEGKKRLYGMRGDDDQVDAERYASLFREEGHPRSDNGEFAEKGSGSKSSTAIASTNVVQTSQKRPSKKPAGNQDSLFAMAGDQQGLFGKKAPVVGTLAGGGEGPKRSTAAPRQQIYIKGDLGEYTGTTSQAHGATWYEVEMLEGRDAGATKVTMRPPDGSETPHQAEKKRLEKEMQEGFRRLAAMTNKTSGYVPGTVSPLDDLAIKQHAPLPGQRSLLGDQFNEAINQAMGSGPATPAEAAPALSALPATRPSQKSLFSRITSRINASLIIQDEERRQRYSLEGLNWSHEEKAKSVLAMLKRNRVKTAEDLDRIEKLEKFLGQINGDDAAPIQPSQPSQAGQPGQPDKSSQPSQKGHPGKSADSSGEKWITIGGHSGPGGKHVGGTPVKVDGSGQITAGPPAIKFKAIDDIDGDDNDDGKTDQPTSVQAKPKGLPGWNDRSATKPQSVAPPAAPVAPAAVQPSAAPPTTSDSIPDTPPDSREKTKVGPALATPQSLKVDPERFQYKLNTNKAGVTDQFSDVKFNPELAGSVHVWRDPDTGEDYVVNGHHRHDLAMRSGYTGPLQVHYLDAPTAEAARAKGALINIAGGNGTAVDAAKFMRDTGMSPDELREEGISLKGAVARDASNLSRLSPNIFRRLALGTYRQGRALAISQHLHNHDDQDRLDKWIDAHEEARNRDLSDSTVEEMAREAAMANRHKETTKGLFGEEEQDRGLFVERAELKGALRRDLSSRLKKFQAVSTDRSANVLKGHNTIDAERNRAEAARLANFLDDFDRETSYKGPVSDRLNQAAAELARQPQRRKEILDGLAHDIRALLATVPPHDPRGAEGDDPGRGEAGEGGSAEPEPGRQYAPAAGQRGFFSRQRQQFRQPVDPKAMPLAGPQLVLSGIREEFNRSINRAIYSQQRICS